MEESECPICFKSLPMNVIESHVDVCLTSNSSSSRVNDDDTSVKKRQKVDMASWCGKSPVQDDCATNSANNNGNAESRFRLKSGTKSPKTPVTSKPTGKKLYTSPAPDAASAPHGDRETTSAAAVSVHHKQTNKPLAEQMRPFALSDFVGQSHILGEQSLLRTAIGAQNIPSMILWGPPGCGKTSLANVIANQSKAAGRAKFVVLSAATSNVAEVKDAIKVAKNDWTFYKRKTVLFLDEIHRFNKLQQDIFLPHVENGTITLIGATTENPSFSLNSALLSRCRVFVLEKLSVENVEKILRRALEHLNVELVSEESPEPGTRHVRVEDDAVKVLANLSDGDARNALNSLQLAVHAQETKLKCADVDKVIGPISVSDIKESLQRSHMLYDRKGDEHYNCISALHKSMRGHDADASLYWLGRMLTGGEDPRYVARRLIRFASEDVGLADPMALLQAVAAYDACQLIGMPECEVNLAQCAVYLARAPKSTSVYEAYSRVKDCINNHEGPLPGVPLHLRNAPTRLMKDLGYAKGYKYNPKYSGPVDQDYMPECLKGVKFLKDS